MNLSFAEEGSIRLVNGSNSLEGRVEVNIHGHWGTVCGNEWDLKDATVVCHQLGYPAALQAHNRAIFGRGSGLIWLDYVTCTGKERNLTQCRSNGLGVHSCYHYQDAGVTCSSESIRVACNSLVYKAKHSIYEKIYIKYAKGQPCKLDCSIYLHSILFKALAIVTEQFSQL